MMKIKRFLITTLILTVLLLSSISAVNATGEDPAPIRGMGSIVIEK